MPCEIIWKVLYNLTFTHSELVSYSGFSYTAGKSHNNKTSA